jgi:hypothetical protein
MLAKRSLVRTARQNWKPFIFGITKSSSTRSMGTSAVRRASSAICPSAAASAS